MGIPKDLTGQRFGRLTALSAERDTSGRRFVWTCLCDCGNYTKATTVALTHSRKQSCGCIHREGLSKRNTKHGYTKERLYRTWKAMRSRCNNHNHKSYYRYGERGIHVCTEWDNSFLAFREWAYANGYSESIPTRECSLDRIDVNKDYSPENCRWVDMLTQANNTRYNRRITLNGQTKTLAEWSRSTGIDSDVIRNRLDKLGWSAEKALTTPIRKKGHMA